MTPEEQRLKEIYAQMRDLRKEQVVIRRTILENCGYRRKDRVKGTAGKHTDYEGNIEWVGVSIWGRLNISIDWHQQPDGTPYVPVYYGDKGETLAPGQFVLV